MSRQSTTEAVLAADTKVALFVSDWQPDSRQVNTTCTLPLTGRRWRGTGGGLAIPQGGPGGLAVPAFRDTEVSWPRVRATRPAWRAAVHSWLVLGVVASCLLTSGCWFKLDFIKSKEISTGMFLSLYISLLLGVRAECWSYRTVIPVTRR